MFEMFSFWIMDHFAVFTIILALAMASAVLTRVLIVHLKERHKQ